MRLGKSQFVIAEILNYICICSHLVQAFGRHGAIDIYMNAPSTRLVVCGTKAHKTVARHSREKREKSATPQHMAQQPQQLELRALLQRRALENGGWQMSVLLGQYPTACARKEQPVHNCIRTLASRLNSAAKTLNSWMVSAKLMSSSPNVFVPFSAVGGVSVFVLLHWFGGVPGGGGGLALLPGRRQLAGEPRCGI